jgi:hypothetical protein
MLAWNLQPLPDGLTPQSLRRTYASLLYAVGESPVYVRARSGTRDATLTLNYYAREMDRRDGEPERLKALVDGRELVATGSTLIVSDPVEEDVEPAEPVESGTLPE